MPKRDLLENLDYEFKLNVEDTPITLSTNSSGQEMVKIGEEDASEFSIDSLDDVISGLEQIREVRSAIRNRSRRERDEND